MGLLIVLAGAAIWDARSIIRTEPAPQVPAQTTAPEFDVAGQIVNQIGEPIADVCVTTHIIDAEGDQVTRSRADGQFLLHRVSRGSVKLLITAQGYAAQLRDVQVDGATPPIKVVLSPGSVIHGHVADPKGNPIADATVLLMWDPFNFNSPYLETQSDSDGKFLLSDLPTGDIHLEVFSENSQTTTMVLTSRPAEISVILRPSDKPRMTGHATDALTHQPIARFEIMSGALWSGTPQPHFHGIKDFTDGSYDLEVMGGGGDIQAYYLRIEADGYLPQISPPLHRSGTLDFTLHTAPDWTGRVLLPDGLPAAGAQVALIFRDDPVLFKDGKLNVDVLLHFNPIIADDDGNFQLRPQIDPYELFAWSDAGIAHLRREKANGQDLDMTLTPWATLRLKIPWVSASELPLTISTKSPADLFRHEANWTCTAQPGPDGTVVINCLPPVQDGIAEVQLARPKPQWESGPTLLVHLTPGRTTEMNLTDGITVTGHVAGDSPVLHINPLPVTPAGQWPTDWVAAAKRMPLVVSYSASFDSAGRFTIAAVRPGRYSYFVSPNHGFEAATGNGMLTIPAGGNATVDVGEITTSKIAIASDGQPAPPQLGRALDDKPILAADYHGRFLVCVVLDSLWRSAPALPRLDELAAKFGGDHRVALLAINADLNFTGIFRRPAELAPGWAEAYFSPLDYTSFVALTRSNNWPPILIVGPNGTIAASGLSSDNTMAKLTELLQLQSH
jgi:hypothetical protein